MLWALRGGDGGSFAVVTRCTYATHAVPADGVTVLAWTVGFVQGAPSAAAFLDLHFANVRTMAFGDVVAGGYVGFGMAGMSATLVLNASMAAGLVDGTRAAFLAQPQHFPWSRTPRRRTAA